MRLNKLKKFIEEQPSLELRKVDFYMALLDRIHFLLHKHLGGKQNKLAEALGVSEAAVSKLINGVKNIETDTIFKLEEVFGESILAVITNKEDRNADYTTIGTSATIKSSMAINATGELNEISFTATNLKIETSNSNKPENTTFS